MSPLDRQKDFEARWQTHRPGDAPPDWTAALPEQGDCPPELLEMLVQTDIEYRVKNGAPKIDVRDYFEHPRLNGRKPDEAIVRSCLAWEDRLRLQDLMSNFHSGTSTGPYISHIARNERIEVQGYVLHEMVGEGGMGVVYRATQNRLHRDVALKMVLGHQRANSNELIRFLAEAESIAAIDHPHVVRVIEFGNANGSPYLAMEYLPGGSLTQKLAKGPLPPMRAVELVRKLALAVQAAHDRQIVHRDLKPGNVLFDTSGEPRVTDFGLAKRAGGSDLTNTRAIVGTPAYMAPEQARGGTKFVGPQADVYSLGVIIYECLAGVRPFNDPDPMVLLRKVADDDAPSLRSHNAALPRDLELVVHKCLAKDPAERYASATALAEDLRRWLAGEPVSVKAAGSIERTFKWIKRNKLAAGILTASVLAAIVTSTVSVIAYRESERADEESATAKLAAFAANEERKVARRQNAKADEKVKELTDRVRQLEAILNPPREVAPMPRRLR